jgi:hypothetical protein
MTNKIPMKKAFCLSLLLVAVTIGAHSQYENNDAVYLRLTKEYVLNSDGSMDYHYTKQQKLLTYRSFTNLYGETFITYNPAYQELKIGEPYTIMADGKKVTGPKNAFNEVLPSAAANAPAYNNLREMVITHTATERNAVLNLDYTIHTKKGFWPALMGCEVLAEIEPVKELTLRVKVPASVTLSYKMVSTGQAPVITTEGTSRVYTWSLKDVPAMPTEENQAGGNELVPRVIFSTDAGRDEIYEGFMKQPAFSYESNDAMKKAVAAIVSETGEKMNIALKLQDKVINEFRLWPIQMKYTGFTCRPAAVTWNSNGGTLVEKAVLLIALLREAGIQAEPVAVVRKALYDEKIGTLMDIDDILVKTAIAETGNIYLSLATLNSQNLLYTLPSRVLISLKATGKPSDTKTDDVKSKATLTGTFVISDKKQLSGEISASLSNGFDPYLQVVRDKNKAKSWFGGGIASGDLKDLQISTPGMTESFCSYTVQKEKPFRKDSNFYFFSLPLITNGIDSWGIHLLPQNRVTNFEIPSEAEETYDISLTLPSGLKLFTPERKIEVSNKAGSFTYSVKKDGDKVSVKKSIRLTQRLIEPAKYADFKALMDSWNNDRYREIILEQ